MIVEINVTNEKIKLLVPNLLRKPFHKKPDKLIWRIHTHTLNFYNLISYTKIIYLKNTSFTKLHLNAK